MQRIPCYRVSQHLYPTDIAIVVLKNKKDLGQGGSQGIEDGIAIGIALAGASPDQVAERLDVYEKIRKQRAGTLQIMSNASQTDARKIYQTASKHLSPETMPS